MSQPLLNLDHNTISSHIPWSPGCSISGVKNPNIKIQFGDLATRKNRSGSLDTKRGIITLRVRMQWLVGDLAARTAYVLEREFRSGTGGHHAESSGLKKRMMDFFSGRGKAKARDDSAWHCFSARCLVFGFGGGPRCCSHLSERLLALWSRTIILSGLQKTF